MRKKPIAGLSLPIVDPMHTLVCVSLEESGHAKIKFVIGETYTIPKNYKSYLFDGNYGRIVISIHINSCHSEDLQGKILRYVKLNYFTANKSGNVEHNLKFIGDVTND